MAIREFPLPGFGFADYLLYIYGRAAGVIEAKNAGATLTGVEVQSARYTQRLPAGRWRCYDYPDLIARDKASLDIFWLKDDSLEDSDNLPAPGVLAAEIVEDLQAALEQFRLIAEELGEEAVSE